jgi:uncharacterized membrane protein
MSAVKDAAGKAKDAAGDAADGAKGATDGVTGGLRKEILSSFGDVLGPAIKEMSSQSAEKLLAYAKEQGPAIFKEQALPKIMKSAGVDNPEDLAKAGVGKVGQMMSSGGGITGMAGKLMSKIGGKGGKKGVATGYGQGRRIMLQQHQYIPVKTEDVYRAWTTSEWPEYMHRVNTLDRQVEEDAVRYAIGVKGFWFKKNFTAQIQEAVPFRFIVWSTTQGNIKNTGRVSFHAAGDDLTLMVLNLDMAPSGLREKWVRGFRYHKRGVRSDFHRFSAWVQMRTQEQLDDMDGWLGTIEGGKVVQTHEDYLEEHPRDEEEGPPSLEEEREGERDEEEQDAEPDEGDEPAEGDEDEDGEPEADDEADEPEPEAESVDDEADADADAEGDEEPDDEADVGDEDAGDEDEDEDEDEEDEAEEPEDEVDEEEEEPEDEEEGDDYDEMGVPELRRELRSRDLPSRGRRSELVDRLREDDAADDEEEEEPEPEPERPRRRRRAKASR